MKSNSPWQIIFNRAVLEAREKARQELQEIINTAPQKIDIRFQYAMMNESKG